MSLRHLKKTYERKEKVKERFQLINNNSDVCHIYYDLIITNNNLNTLSLIPATFSENRANAYIDRPEDYNVTVVSLTLDSNSFPLQVVQPLLGSSYDPTNGFPTIFRGIVRGKTLISTPLPVEFTVYWKPEDTTLPVPSSPITTASYNDPYFYNYSYNHFLNLLNKAIYDAVQIINATGQPIIAPYFSYSPYTRLFSYNTDFLGITDANGEFVYFNEALYSLFDGLPYNFDTTPVDLFGNFANLYRLSANIYPGGTNVFSQYTNLNNVPLVPTSNFLQILQNYSSLEIWNPAVSVVFISRNLNVVNTLEAVPFVFGVNPNPSTNNANVSNILFEIPLRKRVEPTIYYKPVPEYTLTNLIGLVETGELQFDVFWKDTFGNLNKFNLEIGSTLVMKLLFRKKVFNY